MSTQARLSARIVMHTLGSLGDLHPYLSLGCELKSRGHSVTIATSEIHRERVEHAGLGFRAVRPDIQRILDDKVLFDRGLDPRTGTEFVLKEVVFPTLPEMLADLVEITKGADLFISHPLTLIGGIVAAKTDARWVSTILAPSSVFSNFDPPVLAVSGWLSWISRLHPAAAHAVLGLVRNVLRRWMAPVLELHRQHAVHLNGVPFVEGQHAPDLSLAMFSRLIGPPQKDWPAQLRVTGFCFYDAIPEENGLPADLERFLDKEDAPIVCTLGSSASFSPGDFYRESSQLAQLTGRRVVLLTGLDPASIPADLPKDVCAFPYAPYSALFPRACAIVHQAGAGTMGQALRAGKPQLIVPFAHDQFDNASRVVRLGFARTIRRERYTAQRAAELLKRLLDTEVTALAERTGVAVRSENGAELASNELERFLGVSGR